MPPTSSSPGDQIDVIRIVSNPARLASAHLRVGPERPALARGVLGRADHQRLRAGAGRVRGRTEGERGEAGGDERET